MIRTILCALFTLCVAIALPGCSDALAATLNHVKALAAKGRFEDAQKVLATAEADAKDKAANLARIKEVAAQVAAEKANFEHTESILEGAYEYIQGYDFVSAQETIRQALEASMPPDDRKKLEDALKDIRVREAISDPIAGVITTAKELAREQKFDEATTLLEDTKKTATPVQAFKLEQALQVIGVEQRKSQVVTMTSELKERASVMMQDVALHVASTKEDLAAAKQSSQSILGRVSDALGSLFESEKPKLSCPRPV